MCRHQRLCRQNKIGTYPGPDLLSYPMLCWVLKLNKYFENHTIQILVKRLKKIGRVVDSEYGTWIRDPSDLANVISNFDSRHSGLVALLSWLELESRRVKGKIL